ncbi:MAG TPA: DUF2244 domain-containing protein [Steroidobacteraceae bacterium]|jgi:uncharacterized membrane protein|nr:DUF2244 domain-containing protein [Steroidobacteraceae bacterium]
MRHSPLTPLTMGLKVDHVLTIQLSPNCSLTPRAATLFFASICLVSFSISLAMALKGLWPIFPFAGAEMLLLGWALRASLRRRHYSQTITVTDERVAVDTHWRERREQVVFPRHWAQVKLRRADTHLHPSRLTIESHGRSYEVGSFLTEEERRALAARLMRSVGRISESPPLENTPQGMTPE